MHISFILSLVLSTDEDLFPTSVQEDDLQNIVDDFGT
jgi:hypothetical protein